MTIAEAQKSFDDFLANSDLYFKNASEMINKGEYAKACELLWGSAVLSIKALAILKNNKVIEHHAEIFNYAGQLAKDLKDQNIYSYLVHLDSAHKNFYNLDKDENFVRSAAEAAKEFLEKIYKLIEIAKREIKGKGD